MVFHSGESQIKNCSLFIFWIQTSRDQAIPDLSKMPSTDFPSKGSAEIMLEWPWPGEGPSGHSRLACAPADIVPQMALIPGWGMWGKGGKSPVSQYHFRFPQGILLPTTCLPGFWWEETENLSALLLKRRMFSFSPNKGKAVMPPLP